MEDKLLVKKTVYRNRKPFFTTDEFGGQGENYYIYYYTESKTLWSYSLRTYVNTVSTLEEINYQAYNGQLPPPFTYPNYYLPVNSPVDQFLVPTDPALPGYRDGYAGQYAKVLSDGNGLVYYTYGREGLGENPVVIEAVSGIAQAKGSEFGRISVLASGGNPPLKVIIGAYQATIIAGTLLYVEGVDPGRYTVRVEEAFADEGEFLSFAEEDVTVAERTIIRGCTDSNALNYNEDADEDDGTCSYTPPELKATFIVPIVNSLRFAKQEATNEYSNFKDYDNQIFCGQNIRGRINPGYHQKFIFQDAIKTQVASNYNTVTTSVFRLSDDVAISTTQAVIKVQNIGLPKDFDGWIAADTDPAKTRIYFNSQGLPIEFVEGDFIFLVNSEQVQFNGRYAVLAVDNDLDLGAPYLTINRAYGAETPVRLNATIRSLYDLAPYNIYEMALNLSNMSPGQYYCTINGSSEGLPTVAYRSEPFLLAASHPGTHCLRYRNNDNAFGIAYSTGIIHIRRVESDTFKQYTKSNRSLHRNPDETIVMLRSSFQRMFTWEVFKQPPWQHEVISLALGHDYIEIDGQRVQCEEGYGKPEYINRYSLSDSVAELEVVGFSQDSNAPDLGDVDGVGSGFIIVKGGYLKRRKS